MNTYWISLPCDLLSSLASFQCSLLHHLHLSSDLGLSKYVNQHSHLNLSRNVRLSVLYDLDFNTPGTLEIDMSDYIQVILQDTPAKLRGASMVPAAKHLFTTHPNAPKINPQEQEIFHHLTMQLMYLSQRGRPDIRTAVAFLSSRVVNPDQDDYMKLGKVIKYLENTIHLTLRLQAD